MLIRRRVERDHVRPLIKLSVKPTQDNLIASNAITLAQVAYEVGAEVWGLWSEDEVVGLLAMINPLEHLWPEDCDNPDAAFVWRLMIGATFQGRGFGRLALDEAVGQARTWGFSQAVLTAVEHTPGSAVPFYQRCGFVKTGRILFGETELLKKW